MLHIACMQPILCGDPNATEYSELALALHDARVAAGLVDGVDLVGPAVCAFGGVHNNMTWDFLQPSAGDTSAA